MCLSESGEDESAGSRCGELVNKERLLADNDKLCSEVHDDAACQIPIGRYNNDTTTNSSVNIISVDDDSRENVERKISVFRGDSYYRLG